MKYAILGNFIQKRIKSKLKYKGFDRNWIPEIPTTEPNYSKLNLAFENYCEYFIEPGSMYINDIKIAKKIVKEYNSYVLNDEYFEIIGVSSINEEIAENNFLGWDIEEFELISLISGYLLMESTNISKELIKLNDLIKYYFRNKLNNNLLFDDLNEVKKMINCIAELNKYNSEYFNYLNFDSIEPVGIYLIDY